MLGTAMPTWATRAGESVLPPVNITIPSEGVESHGTSTSRRGHSRHVRPGSRAAEGAHRRGFLGDVVRPLPHGGAHPGAARGGVPGQAEGREAGRGREPADRDALQRALDSEYSILQGRAPRGHAGGGVSQARVRPEAPAASVVASSPEGHAREHRSPDELAGSPRGPDLPAGEPADSSYPPRLHPPRQSAGFRQARP